MDKVGRDLALAQYPDGAECGHCRRARCLRGGLLCAALRFVGRCGRTRFGQQPIPNASVWGTIGKRPDLPATKRARCVYGSSRLAGLGCDCHRARRSEPIDLARGFWCRSPLYIAMTVCGRAAKIRIGGLIDFRYSVRGRCGQGRRDSFPAARQRNRARGIARDARSGGHSTFDENAEPSSTRRSTSFGQARRARIFPGHRPGRCST